MLYGSRVHKKDPEGRSGHTAVRFPFYDKPHHSPVKSIPVDKAPEPMSELDMLRFKAAKIAKRDTTWRMPSDRPLTEQECRTIIKYERPSKES